MCRPARTTEALVCLSRHYGTMIRSIGHAVPPAHIDSWPLSSYAWKTCKTGVLVWSAAGQIFGMVMRQYERMSSYRPYLQCPTSSGVAARLLRLRRTDPLDVA